jgi:hypothetical protein
MPEDAQAEDRRIVERLALGDWSPNTNAQVVSVAVAGNRAEVALLVNGDYGYWMYFQRDDQGWYERVSGNGPTIDWDTRSSSSGVAGPTCRTRSRPKWAAMGQKAADPKIPGASGQAAGLRVTM